MEGKPLHIYFSVTCSNFQNFWTKFIQWWNNKNNDSTSLIKEHMIITKFYIYTASRNEGDYFLGCLLSFHY